MKLCLGHGPRFHLNLFGPRCLWPCVSMQSNSSIGSNSTISSFLDNDPNSSWTYIHYNNAQHELDRGAFNDIELISLINQGSITDDVDGDEGEGGTSGGERATRRDVRTLFPEVNDSDGAVSYQDEMPNEPIYVNFTARPERPNLAETQYMNLPFARECVPVYSANTGSNRSSNHSRGSIASNLFDDSDELFPVGDHPYGIPSSLLGGVLLNLDNEFRTSVNSEWENWSEFFTEEDLSSSQNRNTGTSTANPDENMRRPASTLSSGGASDNSGDIDSESALANTEETGVPNNTPNPINERLPLFTGQIALPPLPSSNNSSTRSSRSSNGLQQQEWYFYDPRLVPESRTERVTLDTSFRGLQNRCHMSSIIQPPSYDELMQQTEASGASGVPESDFIPSPLKATTEFEFDPPPPYTEPNDDCLHPSDPPPAYDQTISHNLVLPVFNLGLPVNPLGRRLATSLRSNVSLPFSLPAAEQDLLNDVDIDELLDVASFDQEDGNEMNNDTDEEEVLMDEDNLPAPDNTGRSIENNDEECDEDLNNNVSPSRFSGGFFLGRRPPLRWSMGTSPNRWASSENWAMQ